VNRLYTPPSTKGNKFLYTGKEEKEEEEEEVFRIISSCGSS